MSDIEHSQADHGLLDMIESISSNHDSGRLEITATSTGGAFFFKEGKLLDAELGSLTGFQAVNAALSIRDAQFTFNPLISMPASSSITANERIVLKRFFGIDCAEVQDSFENASVAEVDWEVTPEPVIPLSEVEEFSENNPENAPTIEVEPVVQSDSGTFGADRNDDNGIRRGFPSFVPPPRIALYLTVLVIFAAAAFALTLKINERRKQEVVAEKTEVSASPVTTELQSTQDKQQTEPQNLTGEWTIVNTVNKTSYRAFNNLKIGFRLVINQTGKEFTAKGEKVSENGRNLTANDRTPIQVVGSIDGDKVVATFVENGALRKTDGRFVWQIQNAGAGLTGTFVSTAARSSGKSAATKTL
ncbi:MAG TPA: DUF4388 domain-containing protein [Pyrinomonadaceae bacterium]|nr:DUF4388 domain-containing protein [Pyrinomonadaceae bacterium]